MKENSIEENIEILKELEEEYDYAFGAKIYKPHSLNIKEIKAIKHVLADYKRVLKENEELKSVKKECVFKEDGTEECLWHCSNCNKEWLFYEGTPEDNELKYCPHCGAKVTKYENYIEGEIEVANKMEEDLIEKLQKENEQLKKENEELKYKYDKALSDVVKETKKEEQLQKENKEYSKQLDLDYVDNNYIPVQKIKDKIEELDNQQKQWLEDRKLKASDSEIIFARDALQELIEEREEKRC